MNKSIKFWDKMAKSYDAAEEKDDPLYNLILEKTKAYLKPTDKVMDYGCSTGKTANDISALVHKVDALDISSKMIDVAKERTIKHNNTNIEFYNTIITDSHLAVNSYNAILAFHVLHLLEDINDVVIRINELLTDDGVFISITPCMKEKKVITFFLNILNKIGLVPKISSFSNVELTDVFVKNGFEVTTVECVRKKTVEYYVVATKK